ncbi:hypothetical protein AJ80_06858 [Polytolypa hystricis UAMH7299]|uniref:Uncharacterized protein n=1 Tax=Polytolypa hystricis (strain UAMH7299) TaxID=1447883 RepID=A0A2B7XUH5_POLH7|nr:hypothetical protein AJ80_06858 [Polytolypa hystricis UAMH7299]
MDSNILGSTTVKLYPIDDFQYRHPSGRPYYHFAAFLDINLNPPPGAYKFKVTTVLDEREKVPKQLTVGQFQELIDLGDENTSISVEHIASWRRFVQD